MNRARVWAILIVFGYSVTTLGGVTSTTRPATNRVDELISVLERSRYDDESFLPSLDAVFELARVAPDNVAAQVAVIQFLERHKDESVLFPVLARRLSMFGDGFVERVGQALVRTDDPDLYRVFLATLVRMGSAARSQTPLLLKELDEPFVLKQGLPEGVDEMARGAVRLTLAALGAARPPDLRQLESDVRELSPGGRGAMVQLMQIGLGSWATDGLVAALQKGIERPDLDDQVLFTAIVLASGNKLDQRILTRLKTAQDDEHCSLARRAAICHALALAEPQWVSIHLRTMACQLGKSDQGRMEIALLIALVGTMPEDHLRVLKELTTDPDKNVRSGAYFILDTVGRFVTQKE